MARAISVVHMNLWETVEEEVAHDQELQKIVVALQQGLDDYPGYSLHKGRLFYQGRAVLPANSSQIPLLLAESHDSGAGGHSGFFRTYKRLAAAVHWRGMRQRIKDYVASCHTCQQNKHAAMKLAGLLQPLPVSERVWEHVTMDFVAALPKSKGMDTILVVIDRLTKYAHFIPLAHPFSAKEVALAFIKEVVKLHGFPKSIISDRDRCS